LYGDPKTVVTGYTDDSLLQRFPQAKYFALFFPREINKVLARARSEDGEAIGAAWLEEQMAGLKRGISINLYFAVGMLLALVVSMVSVVAAAHTARVA
jgi:hypothetical protein